MSCDCRTCQALDALADFVCRYGFRASLALAFLWAAAVIAVCI